MIEQVFRQEWGRVLAWMVGFLGDMQLAEDVVQDAFAAAAERWPREGMPDRPGAWLAATARNKALDQLRRERALAPKLRLLAASEPAQRGTDEAAPGDSAIPDERLELMFMCCHPALAPEAQVALTLRALGGLSTDEIASAFLVAPETMKRRLSRARSKIKLAGIPFGLPGADELADRLAAVLSVVYLIFNAGYTDPSGRGELAREAISLAWMLAQLAPDEPEAHGLLALMLCHDSRRDARVAGGDLVLLAEQDRAQWDIDQLRKARAVLDRALALGGRGHYVIQAAIASLQCEPEIDWPQVAALYRRLAELTGSPVVTLNYAVAVAQAGSAARALEIVSRLDLDNYPYLHSTRAELLRRLSRGDEARSAYRQALALATTEPERRYLRGRLADL